MHWIDIVIFEPLLEQLREIDARLDAIERDSSFHDPLSSLDYLERLCGEGFVACQHYLIERKGEPPAALAYECGPRHMKLHVAHIINTAANYRKHVANGRTTNHSGAGRNTGRLVSSVMPESPTASSFSTGC